jgi:hypothetical protein
VGARLHSGRRRRPAAYRPPADCVGSAASAARAAPVCGEGAPVPSRRARGPFAPSPAARRCQAVGGRALAISAKLFLRCRDIRLPESGATTPASCTRSAAPGRSVSRVAMTYWSSPVGVGLRY